MPQEIRITAGGQVFETKSFTFPGGELQIQIPGLPDFISTDIAVLARLQSADDLIRLLLTCELLARVHRKGIRRLVVPYFPYARQDRVMRHGEAFSLKPIAKLINDLGFDEVVTCDPHSDVTAALVENIRVIPQVDLVSAHEPLRKLIHDCRPLIVAPDAGAAKKAFAVAQRHGRFLLTASKLRDVFSGEITRTEVADHDNLLCGDVLIVDDICDGGRTFIELAKVLRLKGADRVFLYVTHGIFSQGLEPFVGLIDGIFTTDTFLSPHIPDRLPVPLHVSPIESLLCP